MAICGDCGEWLKWREVFLTMGCPALAAPAQYGFYEEEDFEAAFGDINDGHIMRLFVKYCECVMVTNWIGEKIFEYIFHRTCQVIILCLTPEHVALFCSKVSTRFRTLNGAMAQ